MIFFLFIAILTWLGFGAAAIGHNLMMSRDLLIHSDGKPHSPGYVIVTMFFVLLLGPIAFGIECSAGEKNQANRQRRLEREEQREAARVAQIEQDYEDTLDLIYEPESRPPRETPARDWKSAGRPQLVVPVTPQITLSGGNQAGVNILRRQPDGTTLTFEGPLTIGGDQPSSATKAVLALALRQAGISPDRLPDLLWLIADQRDKTNPSTAFTYEEAQKLKATLEHALVKTRKAEASAKRIWEESPSGRYWGEVGPSKKSHRRLRK